MEEDIVFVVIQYRLNIFGFLTTEDETASGNYGMLDQVEALRWVQKHIEEYGGDPDYVSIIGIHAGGSSVHFHTLSPLSEGLFKNALALGGSALCGWAFLPNQKQNAIKLAKKFDCSTDTSETLLSCLQDVPAEDLMKVYRELYFPFATKSAGRQPLNVFSPRADPESAEPFLPEPPQKLMEAKVGSKKPLIIGISASSAYHTALNLLPDSSPEKKAMWAEFVENIETVGPLAFGLEEQTKDPLSVFKQVRNYYNLTDLEEENLSEEKILDFMDAISDSLFNFCIEETARIRTENSEEKNTYFYMLAHEGGVQLPTVYRTAEEKTLVANPAYGNYWNVLFPEEKKINLKSDREDITRKVIKLLVNFNQPGKSSSVEEWKPLDWNKPSHLVIANDLQVKEGMPFEERMTFWRSLPKLFSAFTNFNQN
jgi:carboxylesterase type B